ncbi:TonB-dependent siderophore receptor [Sphingomonas sp. AP4-R1]|uniref:TonB-dependent siderophore receptor n=1 Tax=Sphingomonas sp. AP4-R1 TaxID=2735134 RepID=UPI0014932CC6|nr:TonB-dependent siderophore receptor [Sphingomonas sp. AP4-R1]QJU58572.1 TonB-dependent siderophore receptor [Sphingomonas sp. AP4-R1]
MNLLLALMAAAPEAAVEPRTDDIVVTAQRTEGSEDYTTTVQSTAVRLPLSKRETPQSMSIVTNAQMRDFKLTDVNQLLATVPGVNVLAVETDRVYYSARGFDIQTFQIDGVGLPFAFQIQTGSIDTSIYDHIEVIRGAPGLLSSTGNPSAVVNFIRKRPTKDLQATFSAQYGSYNDLRLDADVSAPLTGNGALRARVVGAFVDKDSYLDRYHLRRWTGYGIVEGDLGPDTTVSVGYGHQDHKSNGAMWGSIPLYYTDGGRIPLDRSSSTAPDWSSWNVIDRQIFGDVTHQFGNGWIGKVTAVRRAISEKDQLFYVYQNPDRATGLGVVTYPGAFDGPTRNLTLDAYVGGPVTLFGRTHDLMFGVNRSAQQYKQYSSYDTSAIGVSVPLSQLFDGSFPRPNFPSNYTLSLNQHTRRETAYGLVRLSLADPLKLMVGVNVTRAISDGESYSVPSNYKKTRALPYAGVTLDLTKNISAYASYTTIFNPQTQSGADRRVLAPIQGKNLEGGVKGEWLGGRATASLAIFQTRQDNTAESAGFDPTIGQTIYRGVDAKSEGIELEFGGRVTDEIQATGGYTIMRVRGENDAPVRTFVPRQTGRLNLTYAPHALDGLKLGASLQYQSKIYTVSASPLTAGPNTGQLGKLTQSGYAVVDLLARYALNDHWEVSANLKNVGNRKYLTSLVVDQGYYAAPRTILGTITWKY